MPLIGTLRFPAVALRHRDILGAFVRRDLQARYAGSLLGRLWPILQPLILLAVYSFVFTQLLDAGIWAEGMRTPVGPLWVTPFFMLAGILPWICTAEAVARCTQVVVENSNLIKKVAFPSELLPTYSVAVSFVQMLIGFGLFVPLYVIVVLVNAPSGEAAPLLQHLVWLPVPLVLHFVFATGLGMLLAALNVFVRDVGQMVPLATMIWMFLTPIFYRVDLIARNAPEWVVTAMRCNPLYHLLALYRGAFVYEQDASYPLDSLATFAAIAFGTFFLGHGCFQSWKGHFADEV